MSFLTSARRGWVWRGRSNGKIIFVIVSIVFHGNEPANELLCDLLREIEMERLNC